jgi:hypothetical protein
MPLDWRRGRGILQPSMENALPVLLAGALAWFWLAAMAFGSLLAFASAVIWIWMLVEVLTKETDENNTRLLWTLVIIFLHFVGALVYIFVRRPQRIRTAGT